MPSKKATFEEEEKQHTFNFPNRLYRSEEHRILGGVAGGIGEFFGIDPTLIRLFFVLISIFGGAGILVYLIMWIIVPSQSNLSPNSIHENVADIRSKAQTLATQVRRTDPDTNRKMWSVLLIIVGIFLLLKSFDVFDTQGFWPILFIIVGLVIIFRR